MRHADRDSYHLFDWRPRGTMTIRQPWQSCPALVVGRHLVNTSYDSGFVTLTDAQKTKGWHMVEAFAHSPRIEDPAEIPHDQFDEWLIFDAPTVVSNFETMVNYGGFTPLDFDREEKRALYWSQILNLRPLHVLGENDGVYVVTRDPKIVERLVDT